MNEMGNIIRLLFADWTFIQRCKIISVLREKWAIFRDCALRESNFRKLFRVTQLPWKRATYQARPIFFRAQAIPKSVIWNTIDLRVTKRLLPSAKFGASRILKRMRVYTRWIVTWNRNIFFIFCCNLLRLRLYNDISCRIFHDNHADGDFIRTFDRFHAIISIFNHYLLHVYFTLSNIWLIRYTYTLRSMHRPQTPWTSIGQHITSFKCSRVY